MTVQYLIDSENVGDFWIPLLELPDDKTELVVFYTKNSPHMSYESLIRLKESDKKVTFVKCYEGTNALDFQLVSELGYRICQNEEGRFVIVTNDTGYDAAVKYWRRNKRSVKRITGKECRNLDRRLREDILGSDSVLRTPRAQKPAPREEEGDGHEPRLTGLNLRDVESAARTDREEGFEDHLPEPYEADADAAVFDAEESAFAAEYAAPEDGTFEEPDPEKPLAETEEESLRDSSPETGDSVQMEFSEAAAEETEETEVSVSGTDEPEEMEFSEPAVDESEKPEVSVSGSDENGEMEFSGSAAEEMEEPEVSVSGSDESGEIEFSGPAAEETEEPEVSVSGTDEPEGIEDSGSAAEETEETEVSVSESDAAGEMENSVPETDEPEETEVSVSGTDEPVVTEFPGPVPEETEETDLSAFPADASASTEDIQSGLEMKEEQADSMLPETEADDNPAPADAWTAPDPEQESRKAAAAEPEETHSPVEPSSGQDAGSLSVISDEEGQMALSLISEEVLPFFPDEIEEPGEEGDSGRRSKSRRSRSRRSRSGAKKQEAEGTRNTEVTEPAPEEEKSDKEKSDRKNSRSRRKSTDKEDTNRKSSGKSTAQDSPAQDSPAHSAGAAAAQPADEEIARITACIGADNLAELHNQLATFYGDQGKEIYLSIKNGTRNLSDLHPDLKQKFSYYCEIIFAHSEEPEEVPADMAEYLLNIREKLGNLNSLRYALIKHYGKEKGRRYYFLLKPYAKAMHQM